VVESRGPIQEGSHEFKTQEVAPETQVRRSHDCRQPIHSCRSTLSRGRPEIVGTLGPFVAIGRPGEVLPHSGAARLYVGEGDWHERVRKLLSLAGLVILRAGDTSGLWWEVEESAKTVRPERLVFLVPLKQREYDDFRRKAENYLPVDCRNTRGEEYPRLPFAECYFLIQTGLPIFFQCRRHTLATMEEFS
jgi:hypothetical protein